MSIICAECLCEGCDALLVRVAELEAAMAEILDHMPKPPARGLGSTLPSDDFVMTPSSVTYLRRILDRVAKKPEGA